MSEQTAGLSFPAFPVVAQPWQPPILIKVRGTGGALPAYATLGSAGADLYASHAVTVWPGQRAVVPTGIHLEIPPGYVGLIWPRSGLAVKHGLDVLAGVIDSDYRGEVGVVLVNHGDQAVVLSAGDRVAQLLVQPVARALFWRAAGGGLADTDRGEGGFGSTGR